MGDASEGITWNTATESDDAFDNRRHVINELFPPLTWVRVVYTRLDSLHFPALKDNNI